MNPPELHQLLEMMGLSRVADAIMEQARPTIRVHTRPTSEAEISIGASKMGGYPDFPAGFEYPRWHEAMGFIGQFNLASTYKFDREKLLPDHGLLSFFYETDGEPLHSENLAGLPLGQSFPREEKRKGWQVLYFDGDPTTFTRFEPTEEMPDDEFYPSCAVRLSNALTIPGADAPEVLHLNLTHKERSAWIEIEMQVNAGDYGDHQLLGYPFNYEISTFIEADDALNRWSEADIQERLELERNINKRWLLLFQVGSSDDLGLGWAGGGLLHFCIQREHLKARDFSHVWLNMQFL
jgi:uncharacterized protein YwqG